MYFFLTFLFSWAFSMPIHEDKIIVQNGAVIYGEILHKEKDVQAIIYVANGATFVNNGDISNAIILEDEKIHTVEKSKKQVSIKKDPKLAKVVKPLKKVKISTFYKKLFESFHIVKLDDTMLSLVTNYSFSGKYAILSILIFIVNALFFSSIVTKVRYNACFYSLLFKSFIIRPPPLLLKYS